MMDGEEVILRKISSKVRADERRSGRRSQGLPRSQLLRLVHTIGMLWYCSCSALAINANKPYCLMDQTEWCLRHKNNECWTTRRRQGGSSSATPSLLAAEWRWCGTMTMVSVLYRCESKERTLFIGQASARWNKAWSVRPIVVSSVTLLFLHCGSGSCYIVSSRVVSGGGGMIFTSKFHWACYFNCDFNGPQITPFSQCFYQASLVSCWAFGCFFNDCGLRMGFRQSAVGLHG